MDVDENILEGDAKRQSFFRESLKRLHTASLAGFMQLLYQCKKEIELYNELYPEIHVTTKANKFHGLSQHVYSMTLLPQEFGTYTAVKCRGDGNCLYRSASVLICGNEEKLHCELRARTTCELVLHKSFYLTPDKLNALDTETCVSEVKHHKPHGKNAIVASSNNYEKGLQWDPSNVPETVFELDCIDTPRIGSFSGMWHIYALASVLKSEIQSVYPKLNAQIRSAYHRVAYPRESTPKTTDHDFVIMWTRVEDYSSKSSNNWWCPNHFVPCIPKDVQSKGSTLSQTKQSFEAVQPKECSASPPVECHKHLESAEPMKSIILPPLNECCIQKSCPNGTHLEGIPIEKFALVTQIKPSPLPSIHGQQKITSFLTMQPMHMTTHEAVKYKPMKMNSVLPPPPSIYSMALLSEAVESQPKCLNNSLTSTCAKRVSCIPSVETITSNFITDIKANANKFEQTDLYADLSYYNDKELEGNDELSMDIQNEETDESEDDYIRMEEDMDTFADLSSPSNITEHNDNEVSSHEETTILDTVAVKECTTSCLPFPLLPEAWYEKQGKFFSANIARAQCRKDNPIKNEGELLSMDRSTISVSMQDSIAMLLESISKEKLNLKKVGYLNKCVEVGKYILENGPIVSTQDVASVYNSDSKCKKTRPSELYEILCKHFNILQVYISGKAYLIGDPTPNVVRLLSDVISAIDKNQVTKQIVEERIKGVYAESLQYIDTPRDKQVLRGLISMITNISFTSQLEDKLSRHATRTANTMVPIHISKYVWIKVTSQIVRNDMTCIQQHLLTKRIIRLRKLKDIKVIAEGRGRVMKAKQFPELAHILEYAFGYHDTHANSGGGTECHPRLTDGIMYRTADNRTTMKSARKLLLSLAPEGYRISLSSCYNYTMNYRVGSAQAVRHHDGKGVNAALSLSLPPRIEAEQVVINLHWSTANVNLIVDSSACQQNSSMVISKDAKSIVCGDIAPVQKPGRSWKPRNLPDHSWDQSRVNAITPMTFLFVDTIITQRDIHVEPLNAEGVVHTDNVMYITRTGQAVSLIYLSFYEPDTAFKCANELLYLMSLPSLDCLFRNPVTGRMKEDIVLVVDNGPSEQPCSYIVQMLLVRLLKFLNLNKIVQVAFAEYHSKRNFVERAHSAENFVLSRHGPFNSSTIHPASIPGSNEHKANMEAMAQEVKDCINTAIFAGKPLQCFRGLPNDDFIFNDEENLKNFLELSEERKLLASPLTTNYGPVKNSLYSTLIMAWQLKEEFSGCYIDDYKVLNNKYAGHKTCHADKYTTCIVSPDFPSSLVTNIQPLPDYIRWIRTKELHYMSLNERHILKNGVWNDIAELFLPSLILEIVRKIIQTPPDDIMLLIALLAWVKPDEVKEYMKNKDIEMMSCLDNDVQKETWKLHPLYRSNKKSDLEEMCKRMHLPIPAGYTTKHNVVKLIANKNNDSIPKTAILYSGNLARVPATTTGLGKLSVGQLRAILHFHGFSFSGTKDELVIRVYLLKHNKISAMFGKEVQQLKDLIKIIYDLIHCQRTANVISHVQNIRTYSLSSTTKVPLPSHVQSVEDLSTLFEPLIQFIDIVSRETASKANPSPIDVECSLINLSESDIIRNQVCQTGARITVKWTKEQVGDSGWKPGWYTADVQGYDDINDEISLIYPGEPDLVYKMDVESSVTEKSIRIVRPCI